MKNKSIYSALLAITAVVVSPIASATDGTITFAGAVSAQTCTINGGAAGQNFTVTLPTVAAGALSAAGNTAGRTPFSIALTSCTPDTGNVHTFFELGTSTNTATGNLSLTGATGLATNVQIQLLNNDGTKIIMGATDAAQNSLTQALAAGAATLRYAAQYVATGVAAAGTANSQVTYTVAYQ